MLFRSPMTELETAAAGSAPATADVSGIVKKVSKPDEAAYKAKMEQLQAEVKANKQIIEEIIATLSGRSSGKVTDKTPLGYARQRLRDVQDALRDKFRENKSIRDAMNDINAKKKQHEESMKEARKQLKFSDIESIDAEVSRLQNILERTTMSLPEEKKLVLEIGQLKASKKQVAEFQAQRSAFSSDSTADLMAKLKLIKVELDELKKREAACQAEVDKLSASQKENKNQEQDLRKKKEMANKRLSELNEEKSKLFENFKLSQKEWYEYERARNAEKQRLYKEQQEEKKQAYEAKKAAEEAERRARGRYADDIDMCEAVISFLKVLVKPLPENGASDAATTSTNDVSVSGMKVLVREEEDFFGAVKSKKSKGKGKKNAGSGASGNLSLPLETHMSFQKLGIKAPYRLSEVADCLGQVQQKCDWFKAQPKDWPEETKEKKPEKETAAPAPAPSSSEADAPAAADIKVELQVGAESGEVSVQLA